MYTRKPIRKRKKLNISQKQCDKCLLNILGSGQERKGLLASLLSGLDANISIK